MDSGVLFFKSIGQIELEIIQPITGSPVYPDFLKEKGEDLHHLDFDAHDIEEKYDICQIMNIRVI